MATTIQRLPVGTASVRRASTPRLHYRGLELHPADLAKLDAPRAGRRMFWRGTTFDGALLDQAPADTRRRQQFYRGIFF